MNAFTASDYTMYPFATTNAVDFQNLLGVYTDAVFFPLLTADDFAQEGWYVVCRLAHTLDALTMAVTGGLSIKMQRIAPVRLNSKARVQCPYNHMTTIRQTLELLTICQ